MAKATKKAKDEVTDDELAELENLESADDEEPDEDETVEETETVEDEAPKKGKKKDKKGKKGKKGSPKAKQSRASANGKVGTQEIVNYINENGLTEKPVDGRQLRMVLRKHRGEKGVELDAETNRWEWDSLESKPVQAIIGWVKAGEVEATKQEGLARLKENKDAKAKTKDTGKKDKKKKGKKNKS